MSSTAIEKLLNVARAEIGYIEKKTNSNLDSKTANAGDKDFNKYARDLDKTKLYNGKKNGYWWCDIFVDWCFITAFGFDMAVKLTCQQIKGAGAGCTYSAQYYKNKGQFHKSNPKPGDQIFFSKDGGKTSYHTGIVEKVEGGRVYTIEGNTTSSADVVANGGAVRAKSYKLTYSQIGGYGRPDYSLVDGITSTNNSTNTSTSNTDDIIYKPEKNGKVNANNLNVRSGPGVNNAKIGIVNKDTVVTIVGADSTEKWLKISCDKYPTGWVSAAYVTITEKEVMKKTATANLYIRADRSSSSKSLGIIPKDTTVEVSDLKSNWYAVKYKNLTGYCSASYLK